MLSQQILEKNWPKDFRSFKAALQGLDSARTFGSNYCAAVAAVWCNSTVRYSERGKSLLKNRCYHWRWAKLTSLELFCDVTRNHLCYNKIKNFHYSSCVKQGSNANPALLITKCCFRQHSHRKTNQFITKVEQVFFCFKISFACMCTS